MTTVDDAERFRETLDAFVEDFLRLRRKLARGPDGPTEAQREEYRWVRRSVAGAYPAVEESLVAFVEAEPEYDLRSAHAVEPGELPADLPITSWWLPLTLDDALEDSAGVDEADLRRSLHRQHAVLDAFTDRLRLRSEPRSSPAEHAPAASHRPSVRPRGRLDWLNNPWLVTIGGTVIATLLVLAILASFR